MPEEGEMMRFVSRQRKSGCGLSGVQLASFLRNSCSSSRYLKALRPSMKTTGTSSVNWRRRPSSVSTSTSRQRKPPRRSNLDSVSLTISQRWHPFREYTTTSRSRDMAGSLANSAASFHKKLLAKGAPMGSASGTRYNPCHVTLEATCRESGTDHRWRQAPGQSIRLEPGTGRCGCCNNVPAFGQGGAADDKGFREIRGPCTRRSMRCDSPRESARRGRGSCSQVRRARHPDQQRWELRNSCLRRTDTAAMGCNVRDQCPWTFSGFKRSAQTSARQAGKDHSLRVSGRTASVGQPRTLLLFESCAPHVD